MKGYKVNKPSDKCGHMIPLEWVSMVLLAKANKPLARQSLELLLVF